MRVDASGNLLVGGTTSRTRLTLNGTETTVPTLGTASGAALFCNTNSNYGMMFGISGSGNGWIQQQRVDGTATAYDLMLQPSGGNLLVGTTSAINGSSNRVQILNVNTGAGGLTIGNTTGSGATTAINFANSNGFVGAINTSGTATSYNTSSDYRLKENVQPMTGALSKVAALKPCTYKWKADDTQSQGFIAHELQEVVPECVTGEKDAVDADGNPVYQGIDTSFLVATLTAAIKELKAELDAVKAEVALLKGAA
jgi:hypothetical protein